MRARVYTLVAGSALALTLAGCGGSSSSAASTTSPDTGTTTVTSSIDTFTQYVLNLFGANADTAEPQLIDAAMVTAPEGSEPVTIK
ncbi:hypothetical protein ACO0LC_01680 [Undibacterium sp. JH2W]|uniref:hypothetical protein n=1 Tax=Undibacterium sp. JH2W TaxID=3413037 RepID=UPI003BEF94B8